MKLPVYRRYKPSGVEWFGEVPTHWEVKAARFAFSIQLGKMLQPEAARSQDVEAPYLKSQHVQWEKVRTEDLPTMWASLSDETKYGVVDGDLLVCEGGDVGRAGIVRNPEARTIIQNALHRVRPRGKNDLRVLMYVLEHAASQSWFEILCNRSTISHFTSEKFAALRLPIPPAHDQRAIADFLDRETAKIDTLVIKKRTLIERFKEKRAALISRTITRGLPPNVARAIGLDPHPKLKPSGIEWLGEVPEHWEIKKLGHISNVVRGAFPRPAGDLRYFEGDFIAWITVGELTKDSGLYLSSTESMLTQEGAALSRMMRKGTLVLTNSGATLGVPKILAINGCANDGVVAFENLRRDANILFLYYFLASITENLRDRIKQGSGQPNLNTDIIRALAGPFPPASEQRAIVDYLVGEIAKIDGMAAKIETAIECLKEYRTALITAAVTGKIDVRGQCTDNRRELANAS